MHRTVHDLQSPAREGAANSKRSFRSGAAQKNVSIRVAASLSDLMQIVAIRAAVYLTEQACPYNEEFDGNDFCALHLLALMDNEPVGCLRIRFFADFAKLERLAVRHDFRQSTVAFDLCRAATELCRLKGYTRLYGHVQQKLIPFWKRFGGRELQNRPPLTFSDHSYTEMVLDMKRHPAALSLESDPYVLIRPEGEWDKPGPLELSAQRPATSPLRDQQAA